MKLDILSKIMKQTERERKFKNFRKEKKKKITLKRTS